VTNAKPEQVRATFSNCRLIGRRFPLAHVFFGREIIEVATFRANTHAQGITSQGMIVRDNVYGTLEEDAWRRDFTVNALYYNIEDFSLVDYTGGLQDLKDRVLRIIGDPHQRLIEDPVRMLRAIRFAAKLELKLLPDLQIAIQDSVPLLEQVSSARLFEEVLKMFHGGAALKVYTQLREMGLFEKLFQLSHQLTLKKHKHSLQHTNLIELLMKNTDKRLQEGKTVAPAFFLAALLWGPLCEAKIQYLSKGENEFAARVKAMHSILMKQNKQVTIPKRIALMIQEIWAMQFSLEKYKGKKAARLVQDPRFRAGYDLLILRAQAGEPVYELANWWSAYTQECTEPKTEKNTPLKNKKTTKKISNPKATSESPSESESTPILESSPLELKVSPLNARQDIQWDADSPFSDDFYFDES